MLVLECQIGYYNQTDRQTNLGNGREGEERRVAEEGRGREEKWQLKHILYT